MIKAAIFDMDGVLIDSEPFWQAAQKEAFKKVGLEITDDMCRLTIGLRIDEVVAHWHRNYQWDGLSLREIENEVIQGVIDRINERGILMPGVHSAISFFKNKDLRIALASSSASRLIHTVLEKFDLKSKFEVIHSAENETHGKPHPAIYLTTAQLLNVEPATCIAIEDSFNGLVAAKAARMKTICIPDHSMRDETKFDIADVKLRDLTQLSDAVFDRLTL